MLEPDHPHFYTELPRELIATARNYAAGLRFPLHSHPRGQFAYAATGAISVLTPQGNWLVPPQRACWLPAGLEHGMQMHGEVLMLNVFIRAQAVASLPGHCSVLETSPLLRQLLAEAVKLDALYVENARDGRLMALLLDEIAAMTPLALNAPLPQDPRLARLCTQLFQQPSLDIGLDTMAARANMSRRTFTRLFRQQTGLGFAQWRQQACLLSAITRLAEGQAVTRVAFDLGYGSASAFTAAFRKVLGKAPSEYLP
ncbi:MULTISPECIES: helix-turn-helix domain-containing protein [unclassified Janthinobacterium]|uniref:AraC family transcriptional regulator n=1 Tax=unclassified Janthinobacterium TaxID=2610881 RepID=UPI00160B60B7|nr:MULTISPECIES: helix-turn-helix transcriptional regulator [unclassified Janthinobacterium]MBB5606148.1 AraC-like DNA-binding protein [Janthinobacterium sp. S3T4]MBB5611980.1 AraC-like DNA-binding protein [Janthinobacterium sp. S3M3]